MIASRDDKATGPLVALRATIRRLTTADVDEREEGVLYWRERVLRSILVTSLMLSPFVLIPLMAMSFRRGTWLLIYLDLSALLLVVGLLLFHRVPYKIRAVLIVLIIYIVGIYVTTNLGMLSGGPMWLFAFPLVTALFLGLRAAIAAIFLYGLTQFLLLMLIHQGYLAQGEPLFPSVEQGLSTVANNLFLNIMFTFAIAVLINGIEAVSRKERTTSKKLRQEREQLLAARNELQREIAVREISEGIMRESEERYRSLVENTMDGCFICTVPDGRLLFLNQRICELFDFTMEEGLSLTLWDMIPENEHAQIKETIQSRIKDGHLAPERRMYNGKRKDGNIFKAEISTAIITYQEQIAIQGTLRDAEEQLRIQQQLQQAQRFEAIGTLAGGLAHNFNNLLMVIQGNVSLVLMTLDPASSSNEYLENIEQQVKKGADLTRQMLGFARGGKYQMIPLDLNSSIQDVGQMFGSTHKEISVLFSLQEEIWTVEADRGQIEQVLLNLFVNAMHAMPYGGKLLLHTENVVLDSDFVVPHDLSPGSYVKISVIDTGVGMNAQTLERIYEPFFTTKEVGQGTGLGLASTYGIVKNHMGVIEVASEVGRGTTFDIYLPAREKNVRRKSSGSFKAFQKGGETILFVDDEDMICHTSKRILERLGYTVHVADSGLAALQILKKHGNVISLVLLDMVMPEMGGNELFDRLKLVAPDVRVLLSSGYSLSGQAQEILDRGCDDFIQKPFDVASLSNKVREILDAPRLDRDLIDKHRH